MEPRTISDMLCTACNSDRLRPTGSPFKRWERAFTNCAKGMRERGIGYCTRLKRVLEAEREEKKNAKQALREK